MENLDGNASAGKARGGCISNPGTASSRARGPDFCMFIAHPTCVDVKEPLRPNNYSWFGAMMCGQWETLRGPVVFLPLLAPVKKQVGQMMSIMMVMTSSSSGSRRRRKRKRTVVATMLITAAEMVMVSDYIWFYSCGPCGHGHGLWLLFYFGYDG